MGKLQCGQGNYRKSLVFVSLVVCLFFIMTAVGCGSKEVRSLPKIKKRKLTYEEGSIWPKEAIGVFLFKDTKAKSVGDTLTVHIIEQIKAVNNASTKTGRELQNSIIYNMNSLADGTTTKNGMNIGIGGGIDFDGVGATTRSGSLTTTLTAIVTKVLPNGNLVIDGAKELNVNDDLQLVKISGVVRPEDISRSNAVLSTSVAESVITYSGTGSLDDSQRPGLMGQLVSWIWPF